MDDNDAAKFYSDPDNLRPAGSPRRRVGGKALSSHVPVRFSPALVAAVKVLAELDGTTVSTWIRNVVAREVQRRAPSQTRAVVETGVQWVEPEPRSMTYAPPQALVS